MVNKKPTTSYHHGDLRQTLLETASSIVHEEGIESLSLRTLAERVGVSRTASYHHYKNKNELLCAIAERGFKLFNQQQDSIFKDESTPLHERFKLAFKDYIKFAHKNPEMYELMFGRTIWKKQKVTKELHSASSNLFKFSVEMNTLLQEAGVLSPDEDPYRLSQVIWASKHGIAKLLIDGIYLSPQKIEKICECALSIFIYDTSK